MKKTWLVIVIAAIVTIIVGVSAFCYPLFPPRAQIQVTKTKMNLSVPFKFEASLEIIFWFKAIIEMQITLKHPRTDIKDILVLLKYVSLKIIKIF